MQAREREKKFKAQLKELMRSEGVQAVYRAAQNPLRQCFDAYCEYNQVQLHQLNKMNNLQMNSAIFFMQHFKLIPAALNQEEFKTLYKLQLKECEEQTNGLNFAEFQDLLTRIAVKCHDLFDKFAKKNLDESLVSNNNSMVQPPAQSQDADKQGLNDVELTSAATVQSLINYLNIRRNKAQLEQHLKNLKIDPQYEQKQSNRFFWITQRTAGGAIALRVGRDGTRYLLHLSF